MWRKWERYFKFCMQYLLAEKPKGLDFTMRDTSMLKKSKGLYHGYSKTAETHLREIFNTITYTGNEKLLDIGCGKGVVLKVATEYPFAKIAGIEIDERLVNIASNNFKILGMTERIQCQNVNAAEFDGYGDYNVFFLFNPFSDSVVKKVMEKLLDVSRKSVITVIYHNPVYIDIFKQRSKVMEIGRLHDKTKDYDTCIFTMQPKK